jgi:Domain of unknown function (DUF4276)
VDVAYIRPGLFAEGKTDYQLLVPLLRRLTEQLCRDEARCVVDVSDVEGLDAPHRFRDADRATRLLEAAREFWGSSSVLFVHADGAGDPDGKQAEQVDPGIARIKQELHGGACVAVVPVREIEAWALADGDALRDAFGTTLADEELHIKRRARDVERILKPKQELQAAYQASTGSSKRRRLSASDFYTRIGERVELSKLLQVPAFKRVEEGLRAALIQLGLIASV